MEVEKSEMKETIDPRGNMPMPGPLAERECVCGCGHFFYPNRKDKIYLNKQHADFAYNNGKRKIKNPNRVHVEKILSSNDNILHRHFQSDGGIDEHEQYYEILRAEGFDSGYFIGETYHNENEYLLSYRYIYRLITKNDVLKIIIREI